MGEEHPAIEKMCDLFDEFKRPYLLHVGKPTNADENIQNTDEIDKCEQYIDELYHIIAAAINSGGNDPTIKQRPVTNVFERAGIFAALRDDPSLKDSMLRYAKLHLRTYPYSFK